ncbi:MAG: amidohydrolase family protein [Microthrixaceae bacterium]|nr:amidohydrolase family protein [Microthrixaceae bacterium]MCO5321932.1 amidohydrolase family protein [Microthrixaceae bacterium]
MPMPSDIGVIDTMMDLPFTDVASTYEFLSPNLRDRESAEDFEFPVEYMFKDVPKAATEDPVAHTVALMDHHGIDRALIGAGSENGRRALEQHPDRFLPSIGVDPNEGMRAVEQIVEAHESTGLAALAGFPAGCNPQVPINDKRWYPVYAKCSELGVPIFMCVGVPGPRVPMASQKVELLDEVCWFFPELTIVMRHGAEPWEELAVKLMLKWPNLYYSTSAFAPKYYPRAIIDYANTRGADKVMYGGYFPMGLTLERIFSELPDVPLRDEVWPKFLRHNAARVLGI